MSKKELPYEKQNFEKYEENSSRSNLVTTRNILDPKNLIFNKS